MESEKCYSTHNILNSNGHSHHHHHRGRRHPIVKSYYSIRVCIHSTSCPAISNVRDVVACSPVMHVVSSYISALKFCSTISFKPTSRSLFLTILCCSHSLSLFYNHSMSTRTTNWRHSLWRQLFHCCWSFSSVGRFGCLIVRLYYIILYLFIYMRECVCECNAMCYL